MATLQGQNEKRKLRSYVRYLMLDRTVSNMFSLLFRLRVCTMHVSILKCGVSRLLNILYEIRMRRPHIY